MSVLMSESLFIHSFNRFIQTADSFRNEAIGCPYEWTTESINSLDSFKHVDSFINQTPLCVARRHTTLCCAVALIATIFGCEIEQKQSEFSLKYKSLNFNLFIEIQLYKSVSRCSRVIDIQGNIMVV